MITLRGPRPGCCAPAASSPCSPTVTTPRGSSSTQPGRWWPPARTPTCFYLQHIVVLLTPIQDGRFVLTPDTTAADTGRSQPHADDHQVPAPHRRIHADLVVFAQPHEYRSPSLSPADAVRETGDIR